MFPVENELPGNAHGTYNTACTNIVSQRHELKGTQRIYDNFESEDVTIKVHTHDRNLSVKN